MNFGPQIFPGVLSDFVAHEVGTTTVALVGNQRDSAWPRLDEERRAADADRSTSSTEEPIKTVVSCGRGCRGYVGDSGGELVEVGTDHCAKVSLGVVLDPRLELDPKYGDGCGRHHLCATSTPTGGSATNGETSRSKPANVLLRAASSAGKICDSRIPRLEEFSAAAQQERLPTIRLMPDRSAYPSTWRPDANQMCRLKRHHCGKRFRGASSPRMSRRPAGRRR
jgi:hypothetical protein